MAFYSTKTYGNNIGLSAVFRQPNADHSHCQLLHGYSLGFKFTFGCNELDDKNWAVDFGGLKPIKQWLEEQFDHKVVIDSQDPHMEDFYELEKKGLCEVTMMDGVGAEMFAKHAFDYADAHIRRETQGRCFVVEVECSEHGANSAIYRAETNE